MNSNLVIPSLAQPPSVAPTIFKTKSQILISGLKASDLGPIPSILLPCSTLADQPFLLLLQHASGPLHSLGPLPELLSPGLWDGSHPRSHRPGAVLGKQQTPPPSITSNHLCSEPQHSTLLYRCARPTRT